MAMDVLDNIVEALGLYIVVELLLLIGRLIISNYYYSAPQL